MKILVTGGAGYIGSHTCVVLSQSGITPVVLDNFSNANKRILEGAEKILNKKIKLHKVNCADYFALKKVFQDEKDIGGVIHFAAFKSVGESVQYPKKYHKNNVGSMEVLLRVMQEEGVKNLVFSSSCTVYGQPDLLPVTEESPIKKAESPYGETKQICEALIYEAIKKGTELKACVLRYFNPIGAHPTGLIGEYPLNTPNNLIPYITQTAAGIREELTVFGDDYDTEDGTCIRDYIHVMDLAEAHLSSIEWLDKETENTFFEIFNIGTGQGNTVMELVQVFQEVNEMKLNYKVGPRREGDIEKIYAETKKANKILNWQTKRTIQDALKDAWCFQKALK